MQVNFYDFIFQNNIEHFWYACLKVKFLPFDVSHGPSNVKKRTPRLKIQKNRSTNHFPDSILSLAKSPDHLRHDHGVDADGQ